MSAIKAITITRDDAQGRYADVIDAASELKNRYGSATNAIATMVRESASYREVSKRISKSNNVPRGTTRPENTSSVAPEDPADEKRHDAAAG